MVPIAISSMARPNIFAGIVGVMETIKRVIAQSKYLRHLNFRNHPMCLNASFINTFLYYSLFLI